jgi:Molybdopterin-binding domain of aldehyde dehydrogenase
MNIMADHLRALEHDTMTRHAAYRTELVLSARAESLNVETVGPASLLPHGQKCGIRFEADATVTIMLGTGEYGRGYATPYFASLLAARLGVPLERIRLYYTGVHPAVRVIPRRGAYVPSRASVGLTNADIGDLIEALCDRVIEKARRYLAFIIGLLPADIDFKSSSGRFAVGKERHVDILELAMLRRLEISFSQGAEWKALISTYIGTIPLSADASCAPAQNMSGGPPPTNPVSSAMIAKVGAAARHSQSAAPRAAAFPRV